MYNCNIVESCETGHKNSNVVSKYFVFMQLFSAYNYFNGVEWQEEIYQDSKRKKSAQSAAAGLTVTKNEQCLSDRSNNINIIPDIT